MLFPCPREFSSDFFSPKPKFCEFGPKTPDFHPQAGKVQGIAGISAQPFLIMGLTSQIPQTCKAKQAINREYCTLPWRCILWDGFCAAHDAGRPPLRGQTPRCCGPLWRGGHLDLEGPAYGRCRSHGLLDVTRATILSLVFRFPWRMPTANPSHCFTVMAQSAR